ncbi:MAG: TonB family protein [Deltaproteobacteria bacterium]|nr:TonB family protein [Deltaproteobacteria bacterium]
MFHRRDLLTYGIAVAVSFLVHFGMWGGLTNAARLGIHVRSRAIEFSVVKKEAPPPAPPAEKPKKRPPPPVDVPIIKTPEADVPPPPNTAGDVPAEKARPVFGISMSSVVGPGSGSGFAVRVGNTLMKDPEEKPVPVSEVKAYKPVPLHTVNKQPRPKNGPCRIDPRAYPQEAKALGIEGRVQLEVEVESDGTVGDVKVVQGLGHGLDEVAMRSLKSCAFEPAEIGGKPVATIIIYGVTFIIES